MTRDEALAWLAQTEKNSLAGGPFLICSRQGVLWLVSDPLHYRRVQPDELDSLLKTIRWRKV